MTHLGKPKGEYKEELSVRHLIPALESYLNQKVLEMEPVHWQEEEKLQKL